MDTSTTRRDVIRCNARTLDILMKHGRWTNADLARIARVAKGTVGNLRSGARKTCNIDTAVAIENALRIEPGDVFVREVLIADSAA